MVEKLQGIKVEIPQVDAPSADVELNYKKNDQTVSAWNNVRQLGKADLERYKEVNYNVNYAKNHIAELEAKLADTHLSEENRASLQQELSEFKKLYKEQQELATIKISPDGKEVTISPKQDIPAEVLKQKFFIKDGAFRETLKKQYLDGIDNGVFVEYEPRLFGLGGLKTVFNYTRAVLYNDKEYVIPGNSFKPGD